MTRATAPLKPHILHVIGSLQVGGAERVLQRLIAGTSHRFQHSVATLRPGGAIVEPLEASGVGVHSLAGPRHELLTSVRRLRRLKSSLRPDLIHAWMYHANVCAALSGNHQGLPMLWGIRTVADPLREKRMTQWVIRASTALSRRPVQIVYNSHASATSHEALGYPAGKTAVIENGFELDRFRPDAVAGRAWRAEVGIGENEKVLLLPARLHPVKGHQFLLEVLAGCPGFSDGWRLVMLGRPDGLSPAELLEQAQRTGLEKNVIVLPESTQVERALQGADLVAMPSLWGESFPNSVGEAMACGVAVIAAEIGGVPDLLGSAGLRVPPGDVAAWRATLQQILPSTREALAQIGAGGMQRVQTNHSLELMLTRYSDLMGEMIAARRIAA